jgi:hypothetical protein
MTLKFSKSNSSQIEIEIQKELENYRQALKADAKFEVLKTIKNRIKLLEDVFKETQKRGMPAKQ